MLAVYVRVSSVSQNAESQRREIDLWLTGNGFQTADVAWYEDTASATNLERPAFKRLQSDVYSGQIDTVVVWKLDRLSRDLREGLNTLADWCDRGLRVVSITQQIDFNGTLGKMLAAVLLGVAEMEQETRRERQAAGIAAAKQRGVYRGRVRGTKKANPHRAAALRDRGLTDNEIANALNVSRRSVQRYLRAAKA